ncbi:GIY-YIG nuclease family protein [Candidatus Pacebacteria bacterium]|nr:GIY-YIG nuclease family protein [Candidatus Paceibacterota bacterium]
MSWYVYMLRCKDNSLYSGITTDVERRVSEHNTDNVKGAKYTKPRRPVELVYQKECADRSSGASAEAALKQLSKAEKEKLC